MTAKLLSVIIPARNEKYLPNTIDDVLTHSSADTEVIAILDGTWPDPPLTDRERVTLIKTPTSIGQRASVNLGARVSEAEFVMKLDAHCAVDQDFDLKLAEPYHNRKLSADTTTIPRLYNLHVFDWICEACELNFYQADHPGTCNCGSTAFTEKLVWTPRWHKKTDYMCFDHEMHFQYWYKYHRHHSTRGDLSDLLSSNGPCFFMPRQRFYDIEGLDEKHGSWGQFGTEVACKSWLSGGRQVVNKSTWFAHYFRVGKLKFPYHISGNAQERAREYSRNLWLNNNWSKQVRPLSWLIEKFAPVKYWHDEVGAAALAAVMEAGKQFKGENHGT